jgi:hypothetical protein
MSWTPFQWGVATGIAIEFALTLVGWLFAKWIARRMLGSPKSVEPPPHVMWGELEDVPCFEFGSDALVVNDVYYYDLPRERCYARITELFVRDRFQWVRFACWEHSKEYQGLTEKTLPRNIFRLKFPHKLVP